MLTYAHQNKNCTKIGPHSLKIPTHLPAYVHVCMYMYILRRKWKNIIVKIGRTMYIVVSYTVFQLL
jgi:hypothetical protein